MLTELTIRRSPKIIIVVTTPPRIVRFIFGKVNRDMDSIRKRKGERGWIRKCSCRSTYWNNPFHRCLLDTNDTRHSEGLHRRTTDHDSLLCSGTDSIDMFLRRPSVIWRWGDVALPLEIFVIKISNGGRSNWHKLKVTGSWIIFVLVNVRLYEE